MQKHIRRIIEDYREVTFVVGGALGVDTWAFDQVYGMKVNQYRDKSKYKIKIVLILPCVDHFAKWPDHAKNKAKGHINGMADEVYYASADRYKGGWQMQKRNEAMVDMSEGVIAVWNESAGGTANCINYARKKKVPILGYNPETKKQFRIVAKRRGE